MFRWYELKPIKFHIGKNIFRFMCDCMYSHVHWINIMEWNTTCILSLPTCKKSKDPLSFIGVTIIRILGNNLPHIMLIMHKLHLMWQPWDSIQHLYHYFISLFPGKFRRISYKGESELFCTSLSLKCVQRIC